MAKHTHRVTIETTLFGSTEDPIDFNFRSAAEAKRKRALLAAAPEMYEVLEGVMKVLRLNKKNASADLVESVLAKARGESSE